MFGLKKITKSAVPTGDEIKRIAKDNALTKKQRDEAELDAILRGIRDGTLRCDARYFCNYIHRSSPERFYQIKKAFKERDRPSRLAVTTKSTYFGFGDDKTTLTIEEGQSFTTQCINDIIRRSRCPNYRFIFQPTTRMQYLLCYIMATNIKKIFSQNPGCRVVKEKNDGEIIVYLITDESLDSDFHTVNIRRPLK